MGTLGATGRRSRISAPQTLQQRRWAIAAAALAGTLSVDTAVQATTFTWSTVPVFNSTLTWSNASSWNNGAGPVAAGVDNLADFSTLNLRDYDGNVSLGNATQTIGNLKLGDSIQSPIDPQNGWVFTAGTGTLALSVSSGTPTINVVDRTATIAAPLTSSAGLVKTGAGTLMLTGTNSFNGPIVITQGRLGITTDAALGAVPAVPTPGAIVVNGGTLLIDSNQFVTPPNMGSVNINRGIALGPASGSGSGTIETYNAPQNFGDGLTIYGPITNNGAGTGGLIKTGLGELGLAAQNTYTGPTRILQDFITLNFNTPTSPTNNILPTTAQVFLGPALNVNERPSFEAVGKPDVVRTQAIASTTIEQGPASISSYRGSNDNYMTPATGEMILDLGTLTHKTGGVVNFFPGSGQILATAPLSNGILGGWATYSEEWATLDAGHHVVQYQDYSVLSGSLVVIPSNAASNVQLFSNTIASLAAAGVSDINTITDGSGGLSVLNIGAGNTLRLGPVGGLRRYLNGTDSFWTIGSTPNAGSITAGGAPNTPGELYIITQRYVTGDDMRVNAAITDNGTGAVTVVKYNSSTAIFDGANTYSGGTVIAEGPLHVEAGSTLGTGDVTVLPGASLHTDVPLANNLAIAGNGISSDGAVQCGPAAILTGKITLTADAHIVSTSTAAPLTISGKITGPGGITVGGVPDVYPGSAGNVLLTNTTNDYTGDTVIASGTTKVAGNNVIPHGPGAGNVVLFGNIFNSGMTTTLDLDGKNITVNGLAWGGGHGVSISAGGGAQPVTLTIGDGDANGEFIGALTNGPNGAVLSLTKIGSGKQLLSGASTYTGVTTIAGGTLDAATSNALSTSSLINLAGGTLATEGNSANFGPLLVSVNATLDLGVLITLEQLRFPDSHLQPWSGSLTITNWAGKLTGNGNDRVFFGANSSGLTTAQLASINFAGFGPGAKILSTGEVVPASIPEPASLFGLCVAGPVLLRRRRPSSRDRWSRVGSTNWY